jgi:hypothetical protein
MANQAAVYRLGMGATRNRCFRGNPHIIAPSSFASSAPLEATHHAVRCLLCAGNRGRNRANAARTRRAGGSAGGTSDDPSSLKSENAWKHQNESVAATTPRHWRKTVSGWVSCREITRGAARAKSHSACSECCPEISGGMTFDRLRCSFPPGSRTNEPPPCLPALPRSSERH